MVGENTFGVRGHGGVGHADVEFDRWSVTASSSPPPMLLFWLGHTSIPFRLILLYGSISRCFCCQAKSDEGVSVHTIEITILSTKVLTNAPCRMSQGWRAVVSKPFRFFFSARRLVLPYLINRRSWRNGYLRRVKSRLLRSSDHLIRTLIRCTW